MAGSRIRWLGRTLALGLLLALAWTSLARAEKRVALVIGVGNYRSVQVLRNPSNDAKLVAERLRASGFSLVGGGPQVDLDRQGFDQVLQAFANDTVGADVALFYYSGHGVQILDTNWLLPIDANPQKPADLLSQGVDVSDVLKRMELSGAKLKVVLLDACRNNPFLDRGLRSTGGRGLMRMDAPDGTVISYATKPGHVAADGEGDDSPYTTALAAVMRQPGLPILSMFNQLGLAVQRVTDGAQEPWLAASPIDDHFTFGPTAPQDAGGSTAFVAPVAQASADAAPAANQTSQTQPAPQAAGSDVTRGSPPGEATDAQPGASQVAHGDAPKVGEPKVGEWIEQSFSVARDIAVRAAPSENGDVVGQLHGGTRVFVEAALDQVPWLQVRLGQDQPDGYVPADAIPTPAPPLAPPVASSPSPARPPAAQAEARLPISGRPAVHDTATLLVEDQVVRLAYLQGFGGGFAENMQGYLDSLADFVACQPAAADAYRCVTRDGIDVATVALVNGAARLAGDAPDLYWAQQNDARRNGRGIWAPAAPPPPPPAPLIIEEPAFPVFTAAPEWAYGVAEVDGLPVSVIDGERVTLLFDDALGGWGYWDAGRHWHGAPGPLQHDLQRHYGDHRPHGPSPLFARVAAHETAFGRAERGPDTLGGRGEHGADLNGGRASALSNAERMRGEPGRGSLETRERPLMAEHMVPKEGLHEPATSGSMREAGAAAARREPAVAESHEVSARPVSSFTRPTMRPTQATPGMQSTRPAVPGMQSMARPAMPGMQSTGRPAMPTAQSMARPGLAGMPMGRPAVPSMPALRPTAPAAQAFHLSAAPHVSVCKKPPC